MLGLGASDFEFGVDPSADPELALVSDGDVEGGCGLSLLCLAQLIHCLAPSLQALRVSMEEQRQRQEEEARRAAAASAAEAGIAATAGDGKELSQGIHRQDVPWGGLLWQ